MKKITRKGVIGLFVITAFIAIMFQENTIAQQVGQDYPSYTKRVRGSYHTICPYQPSNGICIITEGGEQ